VVGISRDSIKSHQKFREKQGITFVLLSDEDEHVCKLYDVLKEKNMYGKKVIGIERSTFVIDDKGKIIKIFRNVKVDGHAEDVLMVL
jgi:peroxiredoxin Q/BCP